MHKDDILRQELLLINNRYKSLFDKYSFILARANFNTICFSNELFSLVFNYDYQNNKIILRNVSLINRDTANEFTIDEVIKFINKDINTDYLKSIKEAYKKQGMSEISIYFKLIEKNLLKIFDESDTSWEQPLIEAINKTDAFADNSSVNSDLTP